MDQGFPRRTLEISSLLENDTEIVVGSRMWTPVGFEAFQAAFKVALIIRGLRVLSIRIRPISEWAFNRGGFVLMVGRSERLSSQSGSSMGGVRKGMWIRTG